MFPGPLEVHDGSARLAEYHVLLMASTMHEEVVEALNRSLEAYC